MRRPVFGGHHVTWCGFYSKMGPEANRPVHARSVDVHLRRDAHDGSLDRDRALEVGEVGREADWVEGRSYRTGRAAATTR